MYTVECRYIVAACFKVENQLSVSIFRKKVHGKIDFWKPRIQWQTRSLEKDQRLFVKMLRWRFRGRKCLNEYDGSDGWKECEREDWSNTTSSKQLQPGWTVAGEFCLQSGKEEAMSGSVALATARGKNGLWDDTSCLSLGRIPFNSTPPVQSSS